MALFKKRNKGEKKAFKDQPAGKILAVVTNIAGDKFGIPSIKNLFKGEKKILTMSWQKLAVIFAAIIIFAFLVKFEVIELDSLILLIEEVMNG